MQCVMRVIANTSVLGIFKRKYQKIIASIKFMGGQRP